MMNLILLGATGSIGTQTLDIIREREDIKLAAFSFGYNVEQAVKIIQEFHPKLVCGVNYTDVIRLKEQFPEIEITNGDTGLQKIAEYNVSNPVVVNALVGAVGLLPTVSAINAKRNVYLANKETLVIGGEIIMKMAKANDVKIIPIDSEHSAIYQLMQGINEEDIKKLIITASGGSFRDLSREQLLNVTKNQALKHPNWKMGQKITIDSATMMNKGFELIEAHYLFNIDIDKIEPILHRESIIHSMIEFKDGSIYAQLGSSDMHLPIQYALFGPRHLENNKIQLLDLVKANSLHFEEVSYNRYPLVKCAIDTLKKGKLYCTILNAANEAAVKLFLEEKIAFIEIENLVIEALNNPKYEGFNQGEINIPKIMALHNLVYQDVYNK